VWYEDFSPLRKNPKLTPKWQGPARNLLLNGKSKVLNLMHLKKFFTSANETSSEQTTSEELNFKAEPQITDCHSCHEKINGP